MFGSPTFIFFLIMLGFWVHTRNFLGYKMSTTLLTRRWSYYRICGAKYWPTYKKWRQCMVIGPRVILHFSSVRLIFPIDNWNRSSSICKVRFSISFDKIKFIFVKKEKVILTETGASFKYSIFGFSSKIDFTFGERRTIRSLSVVLSISKSSKEILWKIKNQIIFSAALSSPFSM